MNTSLVNAVLSELSQMDFKVVQYCMRDYSRMIDLAENLAWGYNEDDIRSGKMCSDLESAYEIDTNNA